MHGWRSNTQWRASRRQRIRRIRTRLFANVQANSGIVFLLILIGYYSPTVSAQSVLQSGVWVKIGVTTSGAYRLDQAALSRLNPAFGAADPRLFQLYGNGGAPLPQPNASPRPTDLIENAVQVTGEADGRFDAGDALLFFGQSPHQVQYDSTARRFTHQINPYSDTTFYFLTIGSSPGLRMANQAVGALTASSKVTSFNDYQFHEKDILKVPTVSSGREWFGEYLANDTTRLIPFNMPGLLPATTVWLRSSVMAGATVPTQFGLQVNGQPAGFVPIPAIPGVNGRLYEYGPQGTVGQKDTLLTKLATVENTMRVSVTFRKNGQPPAQGYLNFLAVQAQRELRQYDQATWVRQLPAGQYTVRQATAGLRVWNVTNPLVPVVQSYTLAASQEAAWSATRSGDYFLFTDAQMLSPVLLAPVANQNIRGQLATNLLIVTPAAWREQAERLATFRREHDRLSVLVVTTQQVYNEFGSGQPDPTAIRDAARYFYQKQPGVLQYLLLLGDATYDYRNIIGASNAVQRANMVPVYESRESLHPVFSYSSDDYFGFMSSNEGQWAEDKEVGADDHRMDIGVGRLPVKSVDEARTVVDKLIRYASDSSITGDWQTKVTMVADDGDDNTHQQDADKIAVGIEKTAPTYRLERLFLDSYPQEIMSDGQQKAPIVNQLINQAINDGRLIINYSGHGGVLGLADEQVVTLQDILSWKNRRLPLLVTATCQFGRYDDPNANSGAELALLSRSGGAIALLTTTRPVYAYTNLALNDAFYKAVFAPINGQMPRLGDVMRVTKNNSLRGAVNRNFALLGDPSMRLAYPQAQVALTHVNGRVLTNRPDTLRALQTVELAGEVRQQSQRLEDFSGTLRLTLYDKATTQTTLGSEAYSPKMTYQAYTSPIFTGQVPVKQGRFTVRFTLPKDINYTVGRAKLYAYAIRADSLLDASGSYDSLRVGGSSVVDSVDREPPVVRASVDKGTVEGEISRATGPDVTLRISLSDNRGINVARSGLGHELTVQVNDQPVIILNEKYVATGVDGRQGEVLYTFRDLKPGTYLVRVKAWDINNNSSESTLTIVVSERPGLSVRTFKISPNPVVTQATVTTELNRSGEPLNWILNVHDLTGRLLNQQTGQCSDCPALLEIGTWDGRTTRGEPVPVGLYIVRFQVRSQTDGSEATGSGRLVLTK